MMRRVFVVIAAGCVVAAQAMAGLTYKAVTKGEGGKGADMQNITVSACVDGDQARIEVTDSKNPVMGPGTFFLTKDAGKILYRVDPAKKSYMKWNMDEMMDAAAKMRQMAGGVMKMNYSNPKVEKLLDEAGPTMMGLPTRHYKFRTSYAMEMTMMGMKNSTSIVQDEETWTTTKLTEGGLGVWTKRKPPKTGDEQLDALVKASMEKREGFPLKTITETTTTDGKGGSQVHKTTMEVMDLKESAVMADKFEIPVGYVETAMPTLGAGAGEGDKPAASGGAANPFLKMLGDKVKGPPPAKAPKAEDTEE